MVQMTFSLVSQDIGPRLLCHKVKVNMHIGYCAREMTIVVNAQSPDYFRIEIFPLSRQTSSLSHSTLECYHKFGDRCTSKRDLYISST